MSSKEIEINIKKAVLWGSAAILIQMVFFYVIWMNPFVNDISVQFASHPSVKPYEYFGGLDNWMRLRTLFLLVFLSFTIVVFLVFYTNIPGNGWKKGFYFGLLLSLIKAFSDAFNKWTLIVYPNELISLQLVNGVISYVFFGVVVAFLYEFFNVVSLKHQENLGDVSN